MAPNLADEPLKHLTEVTTAIEWPSALLQIDAEEQQKDEPTVAVAYFGGHLGSFHPVNRNDSHETITAPPHRSAPIRGDQTGKQIAINSRNNNNNEMWRGAVSGDVSSVTWSTGRISKDETWEGDSRSPASVTGWPAWPTSAPPVALWRRPLATHHPATPR